MGDLTNADNRPWSLIYRPLNATRREIRLLELCPGSGENLVEGRLVITSIPLPNAIADPLWDAEEELQQAEANAMDLEMTKLRLIDRLVIELEAKQTSLQKEYDSLRSQVGGVNEQSLMVQQNELDSRIKQLTTSIERQRQSRHKLVQIITQSKPTVGQSRNSRTNDLNELYPAKKKPRTSRWNDRNRASDKEQTKGFSEQTAMLKYEAISYCWSINQPEVEMRLDGVSFMAPRSAIDVLCNLRFVNRTRTLWIDALCINQEDSKERAQQVAMMGDIYRNSATTLIWLGPSDDDIKTHGAIQLCDAVAQQILKGEELSKLTDLDSVMSICSSVSIPEECSPELLDVVYLRRWFTRLWVWQEAALSPMSVCHIGSFTIQWQAIMLTAFWWLEFAGQYTSLPDESLPSDDTELNMHFPSTVFMVGIKSDRENPFRDAHLSEIVRQSRHCTATDGRDKIFGLLGMTRWSKSGRPLPPGITPNYQDSKRNCIRNATRVMLEEDGHLIALSDDLLDVGRGSGCEYETWPSWTPIWCETSDIPGPIWLDATYNAHNGRALSIATLAQCNDPDILVLHGYHVDVVETTTLMTDEHFADFENDATNFQALHKSTAKLAALSTEALLLTLLADRHQDEKIQEDSSIVQICVNHLDSEVPSSSRTQQSDDAVSHRITMEQPGGELESVRAELRRTSEGRRLFVTTGGRIGIGPSHMKDGDIAVVLFGGAWPFILRRQKDHNVLIGHSFVRGIMEGEFIVEMEAKGQPAQAFEIR